MTLFNIICCNLHKTERSKFVKSNFALRNIIDNFINAYNCKNTYSYTVNLIKYHDFVYYIKFTKAVNEKK